MADTPNGTQVNRVLVKLRASTPLAAAAANANLRPVFDRPFPSGGLGADSAPQWFIADVPDLAISPRRRANPWDFAHARLADQLGVDEDDLLSPNQIGCTIRRSTWILKGSGLVRPSLRMAATVRRSARESSPGIWAKNSPNLLLPGKPSDSLNRASVLATWTRATTWTTTRCRSISSATSAEALLRRTGSITAPRIPTMKSSCLTTLARDRHPRHSGWRAYRRDA